MKSNFRADLHCHSIFSDGSDSGFEILEKAKAVGLSAISITDHDTIGVYTPELFLRAKELGIILFPGVELSSELRDSSVHVLGYGFDLESESLLSHIQETQKRRANRNATVIEKLKNLGIDISESELLDIALHDRVKKSIGRPHIAQILIKKGYVTTVLEAFSKYLGEGGSCYVPGFRFTPEETIRVIQKANGKAVLAHPHFIRNGSFIGSLLSLPFDGIECYYGVLRKHQEWPWVKIVNQKRLIATGGSDYHGSFKPHISLGCSWVDQETFEKLRARKN